MSDGGSGNMGGGGAMIAEPIRSREFDDAIATPAMSQVGERIPGSHYATRVAGGKVLVRDVEVFAEMEDGALGKVTPAKLRKIVESTNEVIAGHAFPNLVLTHEDDAEVVGRIPNPLRMRLCPVREAMTIYADFLMSEADFDRLIRSGKYVRRSAEISPKNLSMNQVALLGRDKPAIPMPDLLFDDRRGSVPASELRELRFADHDGERPMDQKEMLKAFQAMTPEEKRDTLAKFSDLTPEEKKDKDTEHEDDTDDKKPAKDADAKHAGGRDVKFRDDRERADFFEREHRSLLSTIVSDRKKTSEALFALKYEPKVQRLIEVEGYEIDKAATMERLAKFSDDEGRDAELAYIQSIAKRSPTGVGMVARGAIDLRGVESQADRDAYFSEEDSDRCVAKVQSERQNGKAHYTFMDAVRDLGLDKKRLV